MFVNFVLNQISIASFILSQYKPFLDVDPNEFAMKHINFKLPTFSEDDVRILCTLTQQSVSGSPCLLHLQSPIVIVGDLHGQILDLFRIIRKFGLPNTTKYLFLGDIVDRGDFSIETATFIFALRVLYPENVSILRGNHEFTQLCSHCGFNEEIVNVYGSDSLFTSFIDAFNCLPLVALVDDYIVCVHGGIGPNWATLNQVNSFKRPIEHYNEDTIASMLWSDPSNNVLDYSESPRGVGYIFGQSALIEFLNRNKAKMLIRGHECVQDGYQFMFGNRLLTVFSASNYCGLVNNDSAVITIKPNLKYEVRAFPPLEYIKRSDAVFFSKKITNHSSLSFFDTNKPVLQNSFYDCVMQADSLMVPKPPISALNHNTQTRRYSTTKLMKHERKTVVLESKSMNGISSQSTFKAKLGTPPMSRPPACRNILKSLLPQ